MFRIYPCWYNASDLNIVIMEKLLKDPFTKRGKEVVSIKSDEGKIYPKTMCNSSLLCVLDDDVCIQLCQYVKDVSNYSNARLFFYQIND